MNHPEVMNAASLPMVGGLIAALEHIEATKDFRALILTGEGKGFCSGANLSTIPTGEASRSLERTAQMPASHWRQATTLCSAACAICECLLSRP